MRYPLPCCHPVYLSWHDHLFHPKTVLMGHLAIKQIANSRKSYMGTREDIQGRHRESDMFDRPAWSIKMNGPTILRRRKGRILRTSIPRAMEACRALITSSIMSSNRFINDSR